MNRNSQLSDVLHVLLHMAQADAPLTSETLAGAMGTHPVALRRLLSGLRAAGFVGSEKGHGGGWVISCPLERITLRDIHEALGAPALVQLGFRDDRPSCLVAQAVNEALGAAVQQAEDVLLERLGHITLAALAHDFAHRRPAGRAPATPCLNESARHVPRH
ncbi:Rrf2 family transcriptional regulator [Piscinibacter sakaiensis]|uniref:Rrf2 family transcriptional regulator, group III n=1 Tax=Piscinibacter sakaiensis TaxID=1547922 RepID=A0A0K8P5L5_PISS1|nr:Rrf2 family transcriptional regulator [Piscinibacter sakaiensis]GAP38003.1 Rrf2 family transcriptional regulator, group III [Piscinibacter sakaiensis]